MRHAITFALALVAVPARADDDPADWVFCDKPCSPSPTTTRVLEREELHAGVFCKQGAELAVDAKQRLVLCTTSRAFDLGGLPIAADAYTIFHTNGRVYQTTTRAPTGRKTANGTEVPCMPGLVVLDFDGTLESCTLARPIPGSPRARTGAGIAFWRDGRVAGMKIDEPVVIGRITWPAGTDLMWTKTGKPRGGSSTQNIRAGAIVISGDFTFHADGKLHAVELAEPTTIRGAAFPARAKLELRGDGTLEHAEFVSKRGTMIHGEMWTDTTHQSFDPSGKLTSSSVTHFQSDVRPPKFDR